MDLNELLAMFEDRIQPAKAAVVCGHLTRDQRTAINAALLPAEEIVILLRQGMPTNGSHPSKSEPPTEGNQG